MALIYLIYIPWLIFYAIQYFLAYGTAYRVTKNGGDNGLSLFGWLFVFHLAANVPGLGIFLWYKHRYTGTDFVRQSSSAKYRSIPVKATTHDAVQTVPASQDNSVLHIAIKSLKNGEWDKADELFEAALNQTAKAHIGRLCAELRVNNEESLVGSGPQICENIHYKRALESADEAYKEKLGLFALTQEEWNANGLKDKELKYQVIVSKYNRLEMGKDVDAGKALISELNQIGDYKDAKKMLNNLSIPTMMANGNIVCPLCSKEQQPNRTFCFYCETPFNKGITIFDR